MINPQIEADMQDWSWAEPALDYLDLYYSALKP